MIAPFKMNEAYERLPFEMKGECCPKCGSENVAKILHGYVTAMTEIPDDVTLGGYTVVPEDWHCRDCRHEWESTAFEERP